MILIHATRKALICTTAIGGLFGIDAWAGGAWAQAAPGGALEEVVVTATRRTDTVNRVPLSITAQTQRSLDQQGIRTIGDLQGSVPALMITSVGGPGVANPSIRGIANTPAAATSPTTGFYLDDTPLQKRNTGGGVFTNNGTPLPPLFDLDRVEVLRGPQGTLYGGSSEGGTIRYITPTPSLTTYSTYARAEASSYGVGDPSYEAGVAIGGPIIQDKLGFRASVWGKRTGGYYNLVDPLTGQRWARNVNNGDTALFRGSVLWAPTADFRATLSYFTSRDHTEATAGGGFGITGSLHSTQYPIVEPTLCYNLTNYTSQIALARANPAPAAIGAANCAAATAAGKAQYTRQGASYGPYNLGKYDSFALDRNPTTTTISTPALTLEYTMPHVVVKSITSYVDDATRGINLDTSQLAFRTADATYGPYFVPRGFGFLANYPNFRQENGHFTNVNARYGVSEELRFSSIGEGKPFSWVGGLFYSDMHGHSDYKGFYQLDKLAGILYGVTAQMRYGVPALTAPDGSATMFDTHQQSTHDTELAGFGEGNYWLTDKLRLTAGVRVSRVDFTYDNFEIGPGSGFNDYNAPGAVTHGKVSDTPVSPKVGAQYQITNQDMVYVTAAKGFRPGGVNNLLSPNICNFAVGQFGLNVFQLPSTFGSDSVWSYEAGMKVRILDNRVQLNGDIYRIDWQNVQVQVGVGAGCGVPIVANGGAARSQGAEFEAQANIFTGLNANVAIGYDDAKYLQSTFATNVPGFPRLPVTIANQPFVLPNWSVQVGGRYEIPVPGTLHPYLRADYRWTSQYKTSFAGTAAYAPDAAVGISTSRLNLRIGTELNGFDISAFADNLMNQKGNVVGGRGGCPVAGGSACTGFTTYNPLFTEYFSPPQFGLTVTYRR